MQPSHPTRHLKRVCYAELGGSRVSLPVGVGPAFQATILSDVGLSEGDRGDQPYDLALELSLAPRWRPPGQTVLVETDLVHVAPAPLHVDASGAWDGSQGSFASVDMEEGTCVGLYLGDALRKLQADQLSATAKPYAMEALFTGGRPKYVVINGYPWHEDGSVSNMSKLPPPLRAIDTETAPLIRLLEPARS